MLHLEKQFFQSQKCLVYFDIQENFQQAKIIIFLHCAVDAEAVEVEVLLDVALDDVVEVNEDDVVALFDPDPGFPVNDIISVLDKWI